MIEKFIGLIIIIHMKMVIIILLVVKALEEKITQEQSLLKKKFGILENNIKMVLLDVKSLNLISKKASLNEVF